MMQGGETSYSAFQSIIKVFVILQSEKSQAYKQKLGKERNRGYCNRDVFNPYPIFDYLHINKEVDDKEHIRKVSSH